MTTLPDKPVLLFSTIAVKRALDDELREAFTQETGIGVKAVFEPTNALLKRIAAGARPDVMIGVTHQLAPLGQIGIVDPATCSLIARVRVGIAVARGGGDPDISTVEALVNAVQSARSVAYSRTGASGVYFAELLERLGIAKQVNARATIIDTGFTATAVIDGRADIAVQLISEHRCVPEAKIIGPLPDGVQHVTEFSVVLGKAAARKSSSQALTRFLCGERARNAYSASGMEGADTPAPRNYFNT